MDIFLQNPFATNYNIIEKVCSKFPDEVGAPVSYGPNLMCVVVFPVEAQHIPTGQWGDILRQWFRLSISERTVCNFIRKTKNLAMPPTRRYARGGRRLCCHTVYP